MKRWAIVAITVAAVAVGCGHAQQPTPTPAPTSTGKAGQTEALELVKSSKIEVTDAIKAAQDKLPGRVIDTELRSKDGKAVWEVDLVTSDGKAIEVDVDAESGQVLDSEPPSAASASAHVERMELIRSAKIEVPDAIKAALAKATGRVIDTELRAKDGKTVWEVDVASADGKAIEVDVDAGTGTVIDSE